MDSSPPGPGAAIFVGYRRRDSQGYAGRLADDLIERFGAASVFRDDDIPEGADFTAELRSALSGCDVLLVVIGPGWLTASADDEQRRLDDPADWVRREISMTLARAGWVLPVLVGGAAMPPAEQLPADIAVLARVQAVQMTDRRWEADLQRLCELLMQRIDRLHLTRPGKQQRTAYAGAFARLRELAQAQAELAHRPQRNTLAQRIRATLVKLSKRALLVAVLAFVGWFVLENYASPQVRKGVNDFVQFSKAKAGAALDAIGIGAGRSAIEK